MSLFHSFFSLSHNKAKNEPKKRKCEKLSWANIYVHDYYLIQMVWISLKLKEIRNM